MASHATWTDAVETHAGTRVIQRQRLGQPDNREFVIVYANRSRTATIPAMEAMLITLPSFRSSIRRHKRLATVENTADVHWLKPVQIS